MTRRWLPWLFVLMLASPALAGSYDIFGTGGRATAMGGAYTALSDDIAGLWYNPAGIAQVERLHAELGYVSAFPTLTINGREQDIDAHRGFALGGILSTKLWDHRLSIGLNMFVPDDHLMRFLVLSTNHPHQAFYHNANHTFTALAGAGFQVWRWVSIGVGVNILATELGGVDFTITEDKPAEGSVTSELSPDYAPTAGIHVRPWRWFSAGIAFRDQVEMTLDLPNRIEIPPLRIFDGNQIAILRASELNLYANTNSHFSPRSYELGLAFEPTERWLVAANLTYSEWSKMGADAPTAQAFVTGGLADVFPTTPAPPPEDPDFRDTFMYAVGVEGRPWLTDSWRLDLRGGYRFRPTPVPEQTGANNYLDADAHIFSTGFGVTGERLSQYLPRSVRADGFMQYAYSPERVYEKQSPDDFIGDIKFQQNWWSVGASMTLGF